MKEWREKKGAGVDSRMEVRLQQQSVCLESSFCFPRPVSFRFSLSPAFGTLRASPDRLGDGMDCNQSSESNSKTNGGKQKAERRLQRYPASATRMRAPASGVTPAGPNDVRGPAALLESRWPAGDWVARRHSREMRCAFEQGPVVSRMSLPRGLLAVPAALLASPDLRQAMRPLAENRSAFFLLTLQSLFRSLTWMESGAPFFSLFSLSLSAFVFLFLLRQRETDIGGICVFQRRKKRAVGRGAKTIQKPRLQKEKSKEKRD